MAELLGATIVHYGGYDIIVVDFSDCTKAKLIVGNRIKMTFSSLQKAKNHIDNNGMNMNKQQV